jgi:UDP-glucose 4-epimerase
MNCFVTGGAGFIGSHLVDRLLGDGHEVTAYDNFSTGQRPFLEIARASARFRLVTGDILDLALLTEALRGADVVFHFAANADVRGGLDHPRKDLEQNTIGTFNVLEAMRSVGARRVAFASSGAVYGEPSVFPTPEDAPLPVQTSLYGASKSAGEGLVQAYCAGFGFRGDIFRFVSLVGERYSHGHVFDFVKNLRRDPTTLRVLGDGKQRKSYLDVGDCVDAILLAIAKATRNVNVFNLGNDNYCEVNDSVRWICEELGVSPRLEYTGGERGWVGDSPFVFLDCARIRALGWRPAVPIRDGIIRTVRYLKSNPWILEQRQ